MTRAGLQLLRERHGFIAASLPTAGMTGLELVDLVEPLAGKTVLIVGAGGGVGSFATQFAATAGANVIASQSPAFLWKKRPLCWTRRGHDPLAVRPSSPCSQECGGSGGGGGPRGGTVGPRPGG